MRSDSHKQGDTKRPPLGGRVGVGLLIAVITIAIAVYYSVNPEGVWWFPKCKLYQFTGLKCPICGLQRAIHQFLHGNFLAAFQYNWFLPFSAIYWGVVLLVAYCRHNKQGNEPQISGIDLTRMFYFYCLLAVVWMVIRNVVGL